jgi:hypothetical protein
MRLALLITGFRFTEERVLTPRAEDLYTWYLDWWSPLLGKEYLKNPLIATLS